MLGRVAAAIAGTVALAVLSPVGMALAATPTVLGHDISWPQCPAGSGGDVGGGYGKGYGNPLPPANTGFVVIGLTDGLPFTTNHCLADQVAFAGGEAIPVGAYTMAAYPTPSQLSTYGATGPHDGTTAPGQLFNTGYAMARYDRASMAAVGLTVPFVWIDVESRKVQNWPTGSTARTDANRAVLQGYAQGFSDAGLRTGWYSYSSGWSQITGAWRDGAPMWQTAGSSVAAGYAGAQAVCALPSFNGGPIYLGQRVQGSSDLDATCPALPSFGTLFSRNGVPAPQPPGTVPPPPVSPPSLSALTASATWAALGTAVSFRATVGTAQQWRASVAAACSTTLLRSWSGTTTGALTLRWDGRDSVGAIVPTGLYRVTVTSGTLTRSATLEVTAPGSRSVAGCGITRQYGADRYATSVEVGRAAAPGSRTVVLAAGAGGSLADGLVAAPLAKLLGAPLLLSESGRLSRVVAADVAARRVTVAYLVGGTGSLSAAVVTDLRGLGVTRVVRVSGADRYATSVAVATQLRALGGAATGRAWVAASSRTTPLVDALAAGGVAAAFREPILLTAPSRLPATVAAALRPLGITSTVVTGGTGAVSQAVQAALPSPTRLAGADRYATAALVAGRAPAGAAAVLASGADAQLVDALAGGSFGLPVVLSAGSGLPAATSSWLAAARPTTLRVLGGPTVLRPSALSAAVSALGR